MDNGHAILEKSLPMEVPYHWPYHTTIPYRCPIPQPTLHAVAWIGLLSKLALTIRGTQSYRPWTGAYSLEHKSFYPLQEGVAFLHRSIRYSFRFIQQFKRLHVWRPWLAVYWWLTCLGELLALSSNHNLRFIQKKEKNWICSQFLAVIVLPLESWALCSATAYSSGAAWGFFKSSTFQTIHALAS